MKRWILAIVLGLIVVAGCTLVPTPKPDRTPNYPITTNQTTQPHAATPKTSTVLPAPEVDGARLFQHIRALNFERYTERERARTQQYLAQVLTAAGWQPKFAPFAGGTNVIAQRAGTDSEAGTILVTAHFDTVQGSSGADDNASSIATVLEIARLLGPRQTLRALQIALFDREEAGLGGSFAFTANAANLEHLSGVVNLEMLGYACYTVGCQKYPEGLPIKPPIDRGDFLGIIGDQEHLPLLNAFQDSDSDANSNHWPPLITLPIPFKGLLTPDVLRSDHAPFWAKNIGAVMVGDTANFRNPHYHQPTDTPDTLDRKFLTGSAQRVVNAVTKLLNSRDPLTTSG